MLVSYDEIKAVDWAGKNKVQIRMRKSNLPHEQLLHLAEMDQWCEEKCRGDWYRSATNYFAFFDFSYPIDAVMFKMVWG